MRIQNCHAKKGTRRSTANNFGKHCAVELWVSSSIALKSFVFRQALRYRTLGVAKDWATEPRASSNSGLQSSEFRLKLGYRVLRFGTASIAQQSSEASSHTRARAHTLTRARARTHAPKGPGATIAPRAVRPPTPPLPPDIRSSDNEHVLSM